MGPFADLLLTDMRLVILRSLAETNGYSCNDSILHTILGMFAHKCSRDVVRTQLSWLQEQGLVALEKVGETYVATLTQRGADVAAGAASVPGVKRPGPGD
jgi:Fe2+ or Zn2+ uptake regulation protein